MVVKFIKRSIKGIVQNTGELYKPRNDSPGESKRLLGMYYYNDIATVRIDSKSKKCCKSLEKNECEGVC